MRILVVCLVVLGMAVQAFLAQAQPFRQPALKDSSNFLTPSPVYHPKRATLITGTSAFIYASALYGLNKLWYANYERSSFHWFNDNVGWMQVDKVGHAYSAYNVAKWSIGMHRWTGMQDNKAILIGGSYGFIYLTIIEALDGYSAAWGASPGDLIANTSGTFLAVGQELAWREQRIVMKYSFHPINYEKKYGTAAADRAAYLYGTSMFEMPLKDYNGQTNWVSINPGQLFHIQKLPPWLMISFGYSAEGMLGAESNIVRREGAVVNDFSHIPRYRQYLLSFDVDLTKIKSRNQTVRTLLGMFNVLKIPAPALEYNNLGKVKFYPVYY